MLVCQEIGIHACQLYQQVWNSRDWKRKSCSKIVDSLLPLSLLIDKTELVVDIQKGTIP